MLKPKSERRLQLEYMCSDNEINSSNNSLRGEPLSKDFIRDEILRSKPRVEEEKPNKWIKVDSRQV